MDNRTAIVPRTLRYVIRNALVTCGSLNSAVNFILQYITVGDDPNDGSDEDNTPEISSGPETLPQ